MAAGPHDATGQQRRAIGTIDVYGLRSVSEEAVRQALRLDAGDLQPTSSEFQAIRERLLGIPGVLGADFGAPCCQEGRISLYVGIAEDSSAFLDLRRAPTGQARLPPHIVASGEDFERALYEAVISGNPSEDNSQGHSLASDTVVRAVQERFLVYAVRDLDLLRTVLRTSEDSDHRALAAQVIGYALDKGEVLDDLVFGISDPDESVRNNAARALFTIALFANESPELGIRIPPTPFIEMMKSLSWSDRNKATGALLALTADRRPETLRELRRNALDAVVEMARWRGPHGRMAYVLAGRLAGLSEEGIFEAYGSASRDVDLDRMVSEMPRMINVGGHRLETAVMGKGSPAVVFEAGFIGGVPLMSDIQRAVAEHTMTVAYERAGLGGSDTGPEPRTGSQIAQELRALLDALEVEGPVVLVGHSAGGMFGRVFAHAYPEQVAGMVFLDPSTEAVYESMQADAARWAGFPSEVAEAYDPPPPGWYGQWRALPGSMEEARQAWPLPPVPVAIFTGLAPIPGAWPLENEEQMEVWLDAHRALAEQIPGASHVIDESANHLTILAHPEIVPTVLDMVRWAGDRRE